MISKTRSLEVSDPPKRHCDELEYEDECDDNEYLYELEQEVQRETHVWAHAPCDDEFDKLHVLACLQEAAENDDIASEPTATTASLEVCAQDKLRRALRSIRTASRAQNGLQGWSRGGLFPPVCIKTIRIKEPRLATFDVTRKQCATDGSTVEFAPLPDGTTVISMGMGGMKTVRLIEFVELMKLPTVFISARRNLANMLESKLESMRVHNYLEVPEGKTVGEWCNHTCVIISTEQVDKLSSCIETYSGGILVIDEVSMMAGRLLEDIAAVARAIRTSRAPFGGLQLVFCGDFHQLPPVQLPGEPLEEFCFQSTIWKSCDLQSGTVVLQEPVRQSQDPSFASILNEIREGYISPLAECKLSSCNSRIKPRPTDGIEPTKLYCTNHNVDIANATHLASLPERGVSFTAKDTFRGLECQEERQKLVALLDKRVPSVLELKRGAQVILVRNVPELGLVNGSRGVVVTFEGGLPRVQFDTGSTHCIGKCHFAQESLSSKAMRVQVPFKLGWALTIHKAQGMTLTRAEVQLEGAFTAGQIYVALSRLTSTNGLWIRGGCISTVRAIAHPRVIQYYWGLSANDRKAVKRSRPLDRLFNLQRANPPHAASTWVEAPRYWGEGVITVD